MRRDHERDARRKDRQNLKDLRKHIAAANRYGRVRLREVRAICKAGVRKAREVANAIRARKRAEANTEIAAARIASRNACESRKSQAREKNRDSVHRASAALHAEQQHQATIQRWTKKPAHVRERKRTIDAIAESDSEVVNNLPPELIPVWQAKKSQMKACPRRSRTEVFVEWAAEHPADVLTILDRQFRKDVDRMIADEKEVRARVGSRGHYKRAPDAALRRYEAYTGAPEVPF